MPDIPVVIPEEPVRNLLAAQTVEEMRQVIGALVAAVSALPSAAANAGARAMVTDSNATVVVGHGNTVVGGGSNKVPVYSDGMNWIIG